MQYFEPNFLEEALVLLDRFGSDGRVLAGGTRLAERLRSGVGNISALINVKRIDELAAIDVRANGLRIGALVTAARLARSAEVRERAPVLAAAAASMGARQLQTVATLGGNICSGDPASDLSVALLACDACAEITTSHEGAILVEIDRVLGKAHPALAPGALLTTVEIPVAQRRFSYQKMMTRRGFEMALVAVAFCCIMDDDIVGEARIGLGGAAETPVRAVAAEAELTGKRLSPCVARDAGRIAAESDAQPTSDRRASAEYRRHLVATLTERAVLAAAGQPLDGSP